MPALRNETALAAAPPPSSAAQIGVTPPRALPAYMPELDGTRALAILAVMFFHAHLPGSDWGWLGVPFFFVLSGFLITGLLLDADRKTYFKSFYTRRTLRIFPIYYLTFTAIFALSLIFRKNCSDWLWFLTYTQNYRMGLWNFPDFPAPFWHTWSLAVEEQFYLAWPLLVFLLGKRRLPAACVLLACGAVLYRYSCGYHLMGSVALTANLDTLCFGALLAVLVRTTTLDWRRAGLVLSACAAALVAVTCGDPRVFAQPLATSLPGHAARLLMTLIFGTAMITVLLNRDLIVARFLRTRWLCLIGKISYGLYLYHFIIFIELDRYGVRHPNQLPAGALTAAKFVLSFAVAFASWKLIEAPFGKLKQRFPYSARHAAQ